MMDTEKFRKQNIDTASMYNDFEGESIYEIEQVSHDEGWIDEEYLEKNVANPSWVNFLKEFIDFHIVQNEETGEIFAVSHPSEGQVPLKWGELKKVKLQNGVVDEISRNVSPEDIEQAYDYLCFLENTYSY